MNSERKMDLCSAAVALIINCFVWNMDGFPGGVVFEKCSLSLKDGHYSTQQEDAVAGSSHQRPGRLVVPEL